jgi:hypothetical protein
VQRYDAEVGGLGDAGGEAVEVARLDRAAGASGEVVRSAGSGTREGDGPWIVVEEETAVVSTAAVGPSAGLRRYWR